MLEAACRSRPAAGARSGSTDEPPALRGARARRVPSSRTRDWSERDATGLRLTECRLDGVAARRRASFGVQSCRDVEIDGGSWANASAVESVLRRVALPQHAAHRCGLRERDARRRRVRGLPARPRVVSLREARARALRAAAGSTEADFYEARFESARVLGLLAREREPRRSRRSPTRSFAAATSRRSAIPSGCAACVCRGPTSSQSAACSRPG